MIYKNTSILIYINIKRKIIYSPIIILYSKMKEKRRSNKKKWRRKESFDKQRSFVFLFKILGFSLLFIFLASMACTWLYDCRRQILSGLLCLFSFWALGPFVTSFEFESRTLSVFVYWVFESFLYWLFIWCLFRI